MKKLRFKLYESNQFGGGGRAKSTFSHPTNSKKPEIMLEKVGT